MLVHLKRTKAMVETNFSAIRLMFKTIVLGEVFLTFFNNYRMNSMAKKTLFFVRKINVPFDEINSIFQGKSSVQVQMIF